MVSISGSPANMLRGEDKAQVSRNGAYAMSIMEWIKTSWEEIDNIRNQFQYLSMQFQNVTYSKSNEPCRLEDFKDGLIAVFSGNSDSELFSTQYSNYLDSIADFEGLPLQVVFVSNQNHIAKEEGKLCDVNREVLNLNPELAKREELCDFLFVLKKEGSAISNIFTREKPENELNWLEYLHHFVCNYVNNDPDADGLWRVAQIVPKTGEYLCVDCGYIEELQQGVIFPVCEVCQSGDPEGPSPIEKGYWEYLG